MKKRMAVYLLFFVFFAACTQNVCAQEPYQNYTYQRNGFSAQEPQAYMPAAVVSGQDTGAGDWNEPKDIFISANGDIYLMDSGNGRIVVLDEQFKLKRTIDGFDHNGQKDTFNKPEGVFLDGENRIYVADTQNKRVVILDEAGGLYKIVLKPENKLLDSIEFYPSKVVADTYGRIYVVSTGCNAGILQIDTDGTFLGFYGAIATTPSAFDLFWRNIFTETQLANLMQMVPTVYSNMFIDNENFIYTTVSAYSEKFDPSNLVRKLNLSGNDILKRLGANPPVGDLYFIGDDETESEYSQFVDICVNDMGVYSVLDAKKARVFTYDAKGNLMYVFGGKGNMAGNFMAPEAIGMRNGAELIVVDSIYNSLIVFKPTEYGKLIYDAVRYETARDYENARRNWEEVLKYSSRSELAYQGIGNAFLREENYKEAMKYFYLADATGYYSIAFQYYRQVVMQNLFPVIISFLILIAILAAVIAFVKKWRAKKGGT